MVTATGCEHPVLHVLHASPLPFGCKPKFFFLPNPDHLPWLGFSWGEGSFPILWVGGPCLAGVRAARERAFTPLRLAFAGIKRASFCYCCVRYSLVLLSLARTGTDSAASKGTPVVVLIFVLSFVRAACVLVVAQTLGSQWINEWSSLFIAVALDTCVWMDH